MKFDPRTRAELRTAEEECLTCPLPDCNENDPACPYWLAYKGQRDDWVEILGARIRRNAMRQAIRLALTMEVT